MEFSWNWGPLSRNERWWQGPNVCVKTTESVEIDDDMMTSDADLGFVHHRFMMTSYCDDDDENAYKCVLIRSYNGNTTRLVTVYECCHGYYRSSDAIGCTERVEMQPIMETLQSLGANAMIRAIESTGLSSVMTSSPNVTLFAATDDAFSQLQPNSATGDNSVVVISPELMNVANNLERVISGHVVAGYVRSSEFEDELLLPTVDPSSASVRVNVYEFPDKKAVTVNCAPIISTDKMATNGVIHTIGGVMSPAVMSLADLISRDTELSTFRQFVERAQLMDRLRRSDHVTVFAPTNSAFRHLSQSIRDQLFANNVCITNLVLEHMVEHVICSAVGVNQRSGVRIRNSLSNELNMTVSDDNNEFKVNDSRLIIKDLIADNGVLHVIDQVLVPDQALNVLNVMERLEISTFTNLIESAGLRNTFETLNNFTLFLPSDDAFQIVNESSDELRKLVEYHVINDELRSNRLMGEYQRLTTKSEDKPVVLRTRHNFPFNRQVERSIQCSKIIQTDIAVCGGVIHLIDKALSVPKGNLMDVISQMSEFSQLKELIDEIGLSQQLREIDGVTFFAPTNQAFSSLPDNVLNEMKSNPANARDIIRHHITYGLHCCSELGTSRSVSRTWYQLPTSHHYLRTADGRRTLRVSGTRNDDQAIATVDGIELDSDSSLCDIPANAGLIHAVDRFLPGALRAHLHHVRPQLQQGGRRRRPGDWWSSVFGSMNRQFRDVFGDDLFDDDD